MTEPTDVQHPSQEPAQTVEWLDALRILSEAQEARQKAEAGRDAAYEQAAAHEQKWQTLCNLPTGTCACSYDNRDDVCDYHSPKLTAAIAELKKAEAERDEAFRNGFIAGLNAAADAVEKAPTVNVQAGKGHGWEVLVATPSVPYPQMIRALTPPEDKS